MTSLVSAIFSILIAAAIVFAVIYGVPNLIVRRWSSRFVKIAPNIAKVAMRGSTIIRVLVGSGFKMSGDRLDKTEDYEIIEEHNDDSGGGTLDPIISFLDMWIFRVTGYRIVAASIQDLFGAEILQYKLGRPIELRHTVGKGEEDKSSEFRLSNQVYQLRVKGLETGNSLDGGEKERIPVEIETTFTFRIVNLWKVSFGINFEYFPQVIAALNGALREKVTGMTIDDLLDKEKQQALGDYVLSKNPDLLQRFGFQFVALIIEDVIPDPATAAAMKARRDAELAGRANVRASELQREADLNLAAGKASYDRERLGAIADGVRYISEKVGITNQGLITQVLIADRNAEAVKGAKNSTIILNSAGSDMSPKPVLPIGFVTEETEKKDTAPK